MDCADCPVELTRRYFEFLGSSWAGSVVPLSTPGQSNRPHPSRVMSYSNAMQDLHYVLTLIEVDIHGFTEHSMKRGGATEAARRGATASDIQSAGNWSTARLSAQYIDHPQTKNQLLQKFLE